MQLLYTLLIGAACGWLAGQLMGSKNSNWLFNIILGIVGGFVGHFVFGLLGIGGGGIVADLIFGAAGACLVTWIVRKFFK